MNQWNPSSEARKRVFVARSREIRFSGLLKPSVTANRSETSLRGMMSNITKWRAVSHAGLPDWISLTHTGPHGGLNERNSSNVTQRTCWSRTVNGCEEMKSQQSPLYGSGLLTKAGRQAWMHTYRITAPCCTCMGFKWGHNRAAILSRATSPPQLSGRTWKDMKREEKIKFVWK